MHLRYVEPGKELADMVLSPDYRVEEVVAAVRKTFQKKLILVSSISLLS